jgi:hypothetical protein
MLKDGIQPRVSPFSLATGCQSAIKLGLPTFQQPLAVYDPAEGYKVIFTCSSYEEAQLCLLEDEYEPIEGRISASA